LERCLQEIAMVEKQLRAGHPDVHGLCLALADWSTELRILETQQKKPPEDPAAGGDQLRAGHPLM
jgi:hypothetical protein